MVFHILCLAVLAGCGGGGGSSPNQVAAALAVDSVYPIRGSVSGGQQIQLSGQGFSAGMRVKLDGEDCSTVTVQSAAALTCVTPAHTRGSVGIQAIAPDSQQVTIADAYTYRAGGAGLASFGIVATTPAPGVYAAPFSATLESVLAGFDASTVTRSWVIDGTSHKEGDSVPFAAGTHAVSLAVQDGTGDSDKASYTVIVGTPTASGTQTAQAVAGSFTLSPGNSISLVNSGVFPIINPRLIGAGKPDYVDWSRYLNSLTQLGSLATDSSESSRAALLEAAWKDLSNTTVHLCSPGREAENINDPALLIRGYGYECCSNSSRALAYLGSFLDIPARVRSTSAHEFPEFTVGGTMYILDPDLRYRYWSEDKVPLSAWTTDSTPLSLMNVTHYFAEAPSGGIYETQTGGTLPLGSSSAYPEQTIRSYYFENIVAETIWGYHEAFSGSDYTLYPNEKMAFRQTSSYTPLQWLNSDGTPTGGASAPAVGKVVFRRLWSTSGPRTFQQDSSGNKIIPLTNLPYPVQDLVFYFSKTIDPKSFWLTSGGQAYQIGDFTSNTWMVSAQQLRIFSKVSDLAAVVSSDQSLVAVDIGMQFNAGVFGSSASAVSLSYADDSGDCRRQLSVSASGSTQDVSLGSTSCDAQAVQRAEASFDLTNGQAGTSIISSYGTSYQGSWGLAAAAGVKAYAELSVPRTPGLPGLLRASNVGYFADWQINDGAGWTSLSVTDMSTAQWITLPSTTSSTSLLRIALRQAPTVDVTYLPYLSLVEGYDTAQPSFVATSTSARVTKASVKVKRSAR